MKVGSSLQIQKIYINQNSTNKNYIKQNYINKNYANQYYIIKITLVKHYITGWLTPGELTLLGPHYAKLSVIIKKAVWWSVATLNVVAKLMAILWEQFQEVGANF